MQYMSRPPPPPLSIQILSILNLIFFFKKIGAKFYLHPVSLRVAQAMIKIPLKYKKPFSIMIQTTDFNSIIELSKHTHQTCVCMRWCLAHIHTTKTDQRCFQLLPLALLNTNQMNKSLTLVFWLFFSLERQLAEYLKIEHL